MPFCVLILDGLRAGVVAVGFVDCLRAVAVPGTGGFLAVADDMMTVLTATPIGIDVVLFDCRSLGWQVKLSDACCGMVCWLRIVSRSRDYLGFEAVQ